MSKLVRFLFFSTFVIMCWTFAGCDKSGDTTEPQKTQVPKTIFDSAHKKLNTLVTQLLKVEHGPLKAHTAEYEFENPRDGWIFITSTSDGIVNISIDKAKPAGPVIVHGPAGKNTIEAMRFLKTGKYIIKVQSQSFSFLSMTVRAIPELQFALFEYQPHVRGFGPYDPEYLEKNVLGNINCIIGSRGNPDKSKPYIEKWRNQGKIWLRCDQSSGENVASLSTITADGVDGTIIDEFLVTALKEDIVKHWIDAVIRLTRLGKLVYPYYGEVMPDNDLARTLTEVVVAHGQKIAWEKYLAEQPTQAEAAEHIKAKLKDGLAVWEKEVPGSRKNVIITLSTLVMTTALTQAGLPEVDWKVFIDMQHHLITNDPAFEGVAGIQHYTSGYMNEECMRWVSQLNRHYYIEGNTEMLSSKYGFKYRLDYIENPDFENGTVSWEIKPAEEGSISAKNYQNYHKIQRRYDTGSQGDTFLWTKRSDKSPNIITQQIKNLIPGRLYSMKMIVGDFDELKAGNSNMKVANNKELLKKKAMLKPHIFSVQIGGAEILADKSFIQAQPSFRSMNFDSKFNRQNRYVFSYCWTVFRAKDNTAELKISDWLTDTEPGGRPGQELIYNFVEVQPYFSE